MGRYRQQDMSSNYRFSRRSAIAGALTTGASLAFGGILAGRLTRGAPNILIIVCDALRADLLGKVLRGTTVMPNITRLAGRGVCFTNCMASSSWTLFSVSSLLSSMPPLPNTDDITPETSYFPDSAVSVAELLSKFETPTTAVVKNPWLCEKPDDAGRSKELYSRGFSSYHTPLPKYVPNPLYPTLGGHELDYLYEPAAQASKQVRNLLSMHLDNRERKPFFLYLHYMDTVSYTHLTLPTKRIV